MLQAFADALTVHLQRATVLTAGGKEHVTNLQISPSIIVIHIIEMSRFLSYHPLVDSDSTGRTYTGAHGMNMGSQVRSEPYSNHSDLSDLLFLWKAVRRHLPNILLFVFSSIIITWLVVSKVNPVYRATALISIDRESAPLASESARSTAAAVMKEYRSTQVEILRSRSLIEDVVKTLDLSSPYVIDSHRSSWQQLLGYLSDKYLGNTEATVYGGQYSGDDEVLEDVIKSVANALQVATIANTNLISVGFTSQEANLAARVANEFVEEYLSVLNEFRQEAANNAIDQFEENLIVLQNEIAKSEQVLQDYRERNDLLESGSSIGLTENTLKELNLQLAQIKGELAVHQTSYEQISLLGNAGSRQYESIPLVQKDPIASQLIVEMEQIQKEIQQIDDRYGPKHPTMIDAKSRLDATEESLDRQIARIEDAARKQFEITSSAEKLLQREIASGRANAQATSRKQFRLRELEREVATNHRLYDAVLEQLRGLEQDVSDTSARIIQSATAPRNPYSPNKILFLGIALFLSATISIVLAFMADSLDKSIRSPKKLMEKLGVSTLGCIPIEPLLAKRKAFKPLQEFEDSSGYTESIRSLSTSLITHSHGSSAGNSYFIASALPGEGKSNTSLQLAHALSLIDDTVLVDFDLRKRSLSNNISRRTKAGLCNVYYQESSLHEAIDIGGTRSFDFIGAGEGVDPKIAYKIANDRQWVSHLFKVLEQRYRFVIVDGAPVQMVNDSLAIAPLASGVIFLVKAGSTPLDLVEDCIGRLRSTECNMLGVVLNHYDPKESDYGYGYGYGTHEIGNMSTQTA